MIVGTLSEEYSSAFESLATLSLCSLLNNGLSNLVHLSTTCQVPLCTLLLLFCIGKDKLISLSSLFYDHFTRSDAGALPDFRIIFISRNAQLLMHTPFCKYL